MTIDRDANSRSPVKQPTASRFTSLSVAMAYIDTVREKGGSFDAHALLGALEHLNRAYQEFPELELDRPRRELSEVLRSAVARLPDDLSIPLLIDLVEFDPNSRDSVILLFAKIVESGNWRWLLLILRSLDPSIRFRWHEFEPVLLIFPPRGRRDINLSAFIELLKRVDFAEEEAAADFGNLMAQWLSVEQPAGIDSSSLANAAQSARRPPSQPALDGNKAGSRDRLLAMAQHLRAAPPPQRPNPHPDLFWPSGRMSFDEFLLQWPCEVELPVGLDDQEFIEEAYQAILLRGPDVAETRQYLGVLQTGVASRRWIIEDLLGSAEFRSFERRLRVIWGDDAITEPGRPEAEEMAAVTWPSRSAS